MHLKNTSHSLCLLDKWYELWSSAKDMISTHIFCVYNRKLLQFRPHTCADCLWSMNFKCYQEHISRTLMKAMMSCILLCIPTCLYTTTSKTKCCAFSNSRARVDTFWEMHPHSIASSQPPSAISPFAPMWAHTSINYNPDRWIDWKQIDVSTRKIARCASVYNWRDTKGCFSFFVCHHHGN